MEFSVFVPLMVAVVQTAGQVLSSFVSKAKQVASNYIFDKEFVKITIANSTDQLDELLFATSADIKHEMMEYSVRDVVEDLQAHIASVGKILSFAKNSEISPVLAERLITGGLLPLQVSLEKAELRLERFGKEDLQLYCHVVGTNALIAGYGFAGQNIPALHQDLKDTIYAFQKRLLDTVIQVNREIPSDVPHLLTVDGISDLFELYNSTLQSAKKNTAVSISRKRKKHVRAKDDGEDDLGTARRLHDFLSITFSCSECGFKGLSKYAVRCPSCGKKFV